MIQPFIFTRHPPPGRRFRTPSGPAVHLHLPSTARKALPVREWSSRSSSLAFRRQEGVSVPRGVQPFTFSAIRRQEGVSGPRVIEPFIFTRYPPPGRRIRTTSDPAVYLHSPSAARKAFPDPEWSSRSSSLAIHRQEGASGPRVVQPFIFTRVPPPGRRIRTSRGPAVHLLRYPPSGRRIRTARGQLFFLTRSSAVRMTRPDREWSSRSRQLACRPPASRIRFACAFSRSS